MRGARSSSSRRPGERSSKLSEAPAERVRCLVCRSADARRLYELTLFSIYRCGSCGQVYQHPLPTEAEIRELFAQLYTTGEGSVPELRDYYGFCYEDDAGNPLVQLYERWLDRLEARVRPGRLLDIGCGTGLFLQVARRRGWEPYGVDECEEALDYARSKFGLEVAQGEFSELPLGGRRFDAITLWDIVEHAREPVALLAEVRRRLAPGGVVGLSTPNQRSILEAVAGPLYRMTGGRLRAPLEKFYIEQHFLYFTPETLRGALARAGLEAVELRRELTDLRRLHLEPAKRLLLRTLFLLARATGLENRLFAVARAA